MSTNVRSFGGYLCNVNLATIAAPAFLQPATYCLSGVRDIHEHFLYFLYSRQPILLDIETGTYRLTVWIKPFAPVRVIGHIPDHAQCLTVMIMPRQLRARAGEGCNEYNSSLKYSACVM